MFSSLRLALLHFKRTLKGDLLVPLLLIIVYIIFLVIARGYIPTGEELITTFASFYAKYGYQIIFFAALAETLVLVNIFAPGQIAMVMGIVFAKTGETNLTLVILTVVLGASLGYFINYLLGYYGFAEILNKLGYKKALSDTKRQIKRFGKRGLILGYIHSSFGSFFSLICGAIKMNLMVFLLIAVLSTLFWTILWSIPIYIFGDFFLLLIRKYAFLIAIFILVGLILMRIWKSEEERSSG